MVHKVELLLLSVLSHSKKIIILQATKGGEDLGKRLQWHVLGMAGEC